MTSSLSNISFATQGLKKNDEYMTPKSAWTDIKKFIPRDKIIWEAFYGDGTSGQYLRDMSLNVIHEDRDFFDTPPEYDLIVSNPPFSKTRQVLVRLVELDKPFILIMPSNKINYKYFQDIFRDKGIQLIIPKRRIHFLAEKFKGKNSSCYFDCFYYCYKMNLERDINFL